MQKWLLHIPGIILTANLFHHFGELEIEAKAIPGNIYGLVTPDLREKNYIRNSVKLIIDAYIGKTDFYIYEEDDLLIQVYARIFSGLLKEMSQMPVELTRHVRYPADILLVQGLVYAKYHMTDPTVFYNHEDLWKRAAEKYYSNVQPMEPY